MKGVNPDDLRKTVKSKSKKMLVAKKEKRERLSRMLQAGFCSKQSAAEPSEWTERHQ